MMPDFIPILILVFASGFDAMRDKYNLRTDWKRPHSWLPWPLIDRFHAVKRLSFYLPLTWIWWFDVPGPWLKALTVIAAYLAWKASPKPKYWT
jgi:hypothetical protein